ncbi:MAG: pyrroline-5-carboxylate reductase, partial [Gammaproteobacteria bacterium]
VCVLATRPALCLEVLSKISLKPDQLLISVAAGVSTDDLRTQLRPDTQLVRAMPVNCAEAGASPTLIFPHNPVAQTIFDYCGKAIVVSDEAAFEQGSVIACVYTWFFELFECLIQSTRSEALPTELASELVLGMAIGAASLASHDKSSSPADIAARIATDGTYSKLGLDLLKERGAFQPWQAACQLLKKKLVEDN